MEKKPTRKKLPELTREDLIKSYALHPLSKDRLRKVIFDCLFENITSKKDIKSIVIEPGTIIKSAEDKCLYIVWYRQERD